MSKVILGFILFMSISSFAHHPGFHAAVESIDLNPEIGIPLAGYGDKARRLKPWDWKNKHKHSFLFQPSTGKRDPIRSKVMVIQDANGKKLIFASLDVIGVTSQFVDAVAYKLYFSHDIERDQLLISGTHTHHGPGTLTKNIGLSFVAVDIYKKENFQMMVDRTYNSIVTALEKLEPVELYSSEFAAKGIQENKWRHQGKNYFDNSAKFLLAKSKKTGLWLGGMLNFAAHGNAMPVADLRFSADFPGAIEHAVERKIANMNPRGAKFPSLLFMNGAEGDVRHNGDRGEEIMEKIAEKFASQAQKAALKPTNMKAVKGTIKYKAKKSFIGVPAYPLKICAKRDGFYGNWMKIIPGKASRIPIFPVFPTHSSLSVARIGDLSFITWPGEASTTYSWRLKEEAKKLGHNNLWFLGLTNDYLTYFVNKEEFYEAQYDSCSAFYGWRGGERIHKKLVKMLKKL